MFQYGCRGRALRIEHQHADGVGVHGMMRAGTWRRTTARTTTRTRVGAVIVSVWHGLPGDDPLTPGRAAGATGGGGPARRLTQLHAQKRRTTS